MEEAVHPPRADDRSDGQDTGASLAHERDRPLTFHWRTRDVDLIQALGVSHSTNKDSNAARNSILIEAALTSDEDRWVSYSRRKAFYAGLRRYHGTAYTFTTVLPAVEESRRLGLLEEQRSSPGQRGRQSRFRATPRLMEALAEAEFSYELRGLIRLKDAAGDLIGYTDTDATCRLYREVQNINAAISSITIDLQVPDAVRTRRHLVLDGAYYRPTPPALYRVFNRSSFRMGGRAYGWWQSLPKERRRQLLLDGEPVAEPDFVQMHASILYAQRGHRLEGDAYETGEFSREHGKLAFNVALNAKTRQGAIAALMNKPSWPLSHAETAKLLDALAQRNSPIAADLHADRGIALMRLDSEITLGAVKGCIEAGIPALPVHDSMLTPRRHESRVAEIMEKSAARILKAEKPTTPCRVTVSRPAVPQMPSLPSSRLPSLSCRRSIATQLELFADLAASSLGDQMRVLRAHLGLSQRALGEKVGCRQPHIANVEQGRDRLGRGPRQRLHELMRKAA